MRDLMIDSHLWPTPTLDAPPLQRVNQRHSKRSWNIIRLTSEHPTILQLSGQDPSNRECYLKFSAANIDYLRPSCDHSVN